MKKELDEDIFDAMKDMAEDVHLVSRNYNDELIGIDYYTNLHTLTQEQLLELDTLWAYKCRTCFKEKLAAHWFVFEVLMLACAAFYIAAISVGMLATALAGIVGFGGLIVIIDDKRVVVARRNLRDALMVHEHLQNYLS